jgi:hypothetical protein
VSAQLTYRTVHARLAALRGPARTYRCACGRRATHWSYVRDCPDEYFSPSGPYCTHPGHYAAQCGPCHKRHDLRGRQRDKALGRQPGQLLLF